MRKALTYLGAASTAATAFVALGVAPAGAQPAEVVYNSVVTPLPGNLVSQAFEATSTSEFGEQVSFAGTLRVLDSVTVTMSSWGCQSGSWDGSNGLCTTTPGSGFTEPLTFNVYNVGANNAVGSLIASDTQTFTIPYRPSSTPAQCSGDNQKWYDATDNTCYHGLATNVTFDFGGHVLLPDSVIYSIAYNTSDYGSHPYGDATACHSTPQGCGYDSLNVGLANDTNGNPIGPTVGSDPVPGSDYLSSTWTGAYCDNGAGGTGSFRFDFLGTCTGSDSPVPYVPAVQFDAVLAQPIITSANSATAHRGQAFSFTFRASGVPTPRWAKVKQIPPGLVFKDNHDGTATLAGTPRHGDPLRTRVLRITAINSLGRSVQLFSLTIAS